MTEHEEGLTFLNQYTSEIIVAIARPDSSCKDHGIFKKVGWWNIKPGESKKLLNDNIEGMLIAYYASATGRVWDADHIRDADKLIYGSLPTTIPNESIPFGPECLDKEEKYTVKFRVFKENEKDSHKTVVLNKDN